jgi:integrase
MNGTRFTPVTGVEAVPIQTARVVAAFAHLALDTGTRKSESSALLWSDVDLDAGAATVDFTAHVPGEIETTMGTMNTMGGDSIVAIVSIVVPSLAKARRSDHQLEHQHGRTPRQGGRREADQVPPCGTPA